ncbi:MAG TPA: RNB domain-containing ribonuclease [Candidatus Aquilonibacter sp.]|nr:RNB domain-containing ribonuclease [Candidatus Aquilonibacter sp.]
MAKTASSHLDLQAIAKEIVRQRGFNPEFSSEVNRQVAELITHPPSIDAKTISAGTSVHDLRDLLWSSIDNDDSRDLDQIEVAEALSNGNARIRVGIADVDCVVSKSTPIDQHASRETTTIYAGVRNFPMLPEPLSTDRTSLLENQDRFAVVVEFTVDAEGHVNASDIYRAVVRNRAQLQYDSLAPWLEGRGAAPAKVAASSDLRAQLQLQSAVAQKLKTEREEHGALTLQTDELLPLIANNEVVDVAMQQKNRATELIEDFMIAANGVMARRLENVSSLRRIVRQPKRWDRIVELAARYGEKLPPDPDSKALNYFLVKRRAADPEHFADLSLAVIKLIGPGEYVVERPGESSPGHFGLAVQDYTHSTAPNRRFADVATQRIIKAVLEGKPNPYSNDELSAIAANCTEKGDAARKVERDMSKRLAAVAMQNRIGASFDAVVTGVTSHGTFVRALQAHVEGLLAQGDEGLDVGDKLRVKLVRTDVQHGYIDFAKV